MAASPKIQAMPGCLTLSLKKDATNPHVYYTLSTWTSLDALDAYRQSPLFQETWAKTKAMFHEKAEAYSLVDVQ
jgi:quinol monooxygenase YgiN